MNYLQRLKASDSEKQVTTVLPKLPKAPFGSKGSSQSVHFSENEPLPGNAANDQESKNPQLLVTVWTPAGNQMQVEARDARHAAFLIRMNPKPLHTTTDQDTDGDHGEA
jgi:hypothetical protein